MSLPQQTIPSIPRDTARIAQKVFRNGNRYMQMRDTFGTLYTDDIFAECYPKDGQPAVRPWRLALVTVMQFAEGLSDRQAADAVRDRIGWKYALSLELDDVGFDYSVLSEFRQRLLEHQLDSKLLDVMLEAFEGEGLLKARGKQRTDSTHVLGAVRMLNQYELVHETLRHTLNQLAVSAPAWLQRQITPEWFEWYSKQTSNYLLPKKEAERNEWVEHVGRDGAFLLNILFEQARYPELTCLPQVETLRLVWIDNFYYEGDQIRLRPRSSMPAAAQRVASPYDLEVRSCAKRRTIWTGYKVHLTETCDVDQPNLVVNVETRPATEPDHEATAIVHHHLNEAGYLPSEHFVDAGYMSVGQVIEAEQSYGIRLMGPVPDDTSWQALEGGYESTQFDIDWELQQVTCPQGKVSSSWSDARTRSQRAVVKVKFRRTDCQRCAGLSQCARNREKRRTLTLLAPQAHYEIQQHLRQQQKTTPFKEACKVRAGVEGKISQAAIAFNSRRSRYRSTAKTHLQHLATAAAMNLYRALDWLNKVPRNGTPTSHFARLAPAL